MPALYQNRKDTVLPLSMTTVAALFVIQFIYGWNQYLWPLLITTKDSMAGFDPDSSAAKMAAMRPAWVASARPVSRNADSRFARA